MLECSGSPIFDRNGDLKGYLGIDWDITSRKQAEEQLRTLSCAVDHRPFGVVITDIARNTIYVKPKLPVIPPKKPSDDTLRI